MTSLRLIASAIAFALCLAVSVPQPTTAAAANVTGVMSFATKQMGKPYRWGAIGLARYDCSGFVFRTFRETGLLKQIGGTRRTAHGYFKWFKNRGLVTRSPRKGDLVAWGRSRTTHIGIFVGYNKKGKPLALSALWSGISKHKVHAINVPLKGYLRVKMPR